MTSINGALLSVSWLALTLVSCASLAYLLVALWCLARFPTCGKTPTGPFPPLTVFKPLCGNEPGLERALRCFCEQDYPGPLQIVFGIRSATDPARSVVERLQREFSALDLTLVIDSVTHGPNLKISNLINMERAARHDLWVVSDSDVHVAPDCLARVVAHLSDPSVGAVTCLFRGRPRTDGNWVSQLGVLFIDGWFLPAAVVDAAISGISVCYGPVTVIRRSVLDAGGGFRQLSHSLADDTELGHITARTGNRIAIAPVAVETLVAETRLRSLLQHELRWARTTRALRPASYVASIVTHAIPVALLAFAVRPSFTNGLLLGSIAALRAVVLASVELKFGRARTATTPTPLFLMMREILYAGVWLTGFAGRQITWRGRNLSILPGARLAEPGSLAAVKDALGTTRRAR